MTENGLDDGSNSNSQEESSSSPVPQWSHQAKLDWRSEDSYPDYTIELLSSDNDVIVEAYRVHRCILAFGPHSSGYFSRSLASGMQEAERASSRIQLLDESAVRAFPILLDFVYQCRPIEDSDLEQALVPLRYLATYFDIELLHKLVTSTVVEKGTVFKNAKPASETTTSSTCSFPFGSSSDVSSNGENTSQTSKAGASPTKSASPFLFGGNSKAVQLHITYIVQANMYGDDEIFSLSRNCLAPLCCSSTVYLDEVPLDCLSKLTTASTFPREKSNKWVFNMISRLRKTSIMNPEDESVSTNITNDSAEAEMLWQLFGSLENLNGATSLMLLLFLLKEDYIKSEVNEDDRLQSKAMSNVANDWNERMDMSTVPIAMKAAIYLQALKKVKASTTSFSSSSDVISPTIFAPVEFSTSRTGKRVFRVKSPHIKPH